MNTATSEPETMQAEILLDRDIHLGLEMGAAAAVAAMDSAARCLQEAADPSPVPAPSGPTPESRARGRLLRIADVYLKSGSLHKAIEMYFDIMKMHPETPEAALAEERTLDVAMRHEEAGEMRMARAIYERLA